MAGNRRSKQDRDDFRKRVEQQYKSVFSEQDMLPAPINIREMEALKARVTALQAELEKRAIEAPAGVAPLAAEHPAPSAETSIKEQVAPPTTGEHPRLSSTGRLTLAGLRDTIRVNLRQFVNSRLQVRLTALILLVTVPLLIASTAYISNAAEARIEASANEALRQSTDAMATNISTWLDQNVRTLREMVSLPAIVSMRGWAQEPVLKAVAAAHPYMYLVSTTDMLGMNVARNDGGKLTDYSDRAWFQEPAAGSELAFQTLIGRTSGRPALVASVPIKTTAGDTVGVGMFAADLTHLSEQTRVQTLGRTGMVFLVDADNNVLAHPDEAFTTGELRDLSEQPVIAALRRGESGLLTFVDENGVAWRAYGRALDNGWAVITQQQENEILAPAREFRNVAYALIVLGAGLMLALLWLSIRRTLHPVGILTEAASAIASGNLDRNIEIQSQDELGVLARTFNSMTAQLRATLSTLEQRVAERTHALELAAEVGRAISEKSADIDALLGEAVELIRERFDLHYTQIYLADPEVHTLTLRAGTGEIGAKLMQRGHRLTVGPGSLNGRAASERRAVIVADTNDDPGFLPNPLLPNIRSEMAVPLIAGGRVLGVLDMQSERPGALAESNLAAFEVLAGELAVALHNAVLLADAAQARSEAADHLRHLTAEGWQDFFDAIGRAEKLGFSFDQNAVVALSTEAIPERPTGNVLEVPIALTGARVGAIQVGRDGDRGWQEWEADVVGVAARQLAQHVDNLRLLAQAKRYQALAEESARRLTGEGWQVYKESHRESARGYVYDLNEVRALSDGSDGRAGPPLRQPLIVRNETVGELAAQVGAASEEAADILAAVAERTSLHIETLRLTEELQARAAELQELDRLKTAFLANMSHELRTPLNSILGFTDVVLEGLDGPLTENMNSDLQLIQKNGQHLLHLINDVLDMAKIEAGRMNLTPEKLRIHETIEDTLGIAGPLAMTKGLSLLVAESSDREVEIVADRTRIRQVLLNLVNNALKFTDKGQVSVSATRQGDKVMLTVRDTGVGIPSDHLERIFQEFTQVDTSETRRVGGTGLGLPISRRLVEMHGGRMWAESRGIPGEGSTFYVELPIECKIEEPMA